MSLNLASIPIESEKLYCQATALQMGEHKLTYAQLCNAIRSYAAVLQQLGVGPGDNVALLMPNVPQFSMAYFSILYAGAAVVPLNVLFVEDEIAYHLDDSDAKAIFVWDSFLSTTLAAANKTTCQHVVAIRSPQNTEDFPIGVIDLQLSLSKLNDSDLPSELYPSNADDTAVILYTSGTTGRPKGAELSHYNMHENARYVSERLTREHNQILRVFSVGDTALATLPLFHSFGQTVIQNGFLMNGAAVSLLARFSPVDAANTIEAHNITLFAGVPAMYIALLNSADINDSQLSSLKYAISGGAPLPHSVLVSFEKRFGIPILEGYGLSETSPVACFNNLIQGRKPGTVGPAIDHVQVKVVDDSGNSVALGQAGEVAICGSNIMKGYYKREKSTEETLRNGWFYSGDIGTLDEDGFLTIVDRKKDMIIRGGFNVYPREVEEVLYRYPDIVEAAVIGVPDETHGEEIMAIIATKGNISIDEYALESYCRKHLAAFKVPRIIETMETLPKGPTGKILKRELKKQFNPAIESSL